LVDEEMKRSRYKIIQDILTSAEADWLSITDLADRAGVRYSVATKEARRLVERGLMTSKRESRRMLYKTSRKGKRVADQIRRVLAYLE